MNVISYEIEIKRSKIFWYDLSDKNNTVFELLSESFNDELDLSKDSVKSSIDNEWNNIIYSELKAIYNSKNCCGYGTTENLKFFLFEKVNSNTRSKNNISLEVIAFGKLDANKILNHSFIKTKNIIKNKKLCCNYIDGAQALIYPFNSQENDIYSYELKVKAELISRFNIDGKVYSRWIIMLIGFLLALVIKNNKSSVIPNEAVSETINSGAVSGTVNTGILDSIIASFIFYLLVELTIFYVIPFFTQQSKKYLKITNLTSFIENGANSKKTGSKSKSFETPNI
jgi:hypothetical protein